MTIKPLIILPDPLLRQVSRPLEKVDSGVLKLADDMLETMYDAPGIGLAAIQVGEPLRLLVIDVAKEEEGKKPQVFINPESSAYPMPARPMKKAASPFPATMPKWSARLRSR